MLESQRMNLTRQYDLKCGPASIHLDLLVQSNSATGSIHDYYGD
jgi:hypothetical protein